MTKGGTQKVTWQSCVIANIVQQTPTIKSFFLRLAEPFAHIAGQHVDVRLVAPDGYVAMRSYSIASAPSNSGIVELAIERMTDGEVSTFFHDIAEVGDQIELRGPLGGHFLWPESTVAPVLLIGAGSGVVPLMAMIRHRCTRAQTVPTALLLSSRTLSDVLFAGELLAMEKNDPQFKLALAITRDALARPTDFAARINSDIIAEVITRLPTAPAHVFICGSNRFVDVAADGVIAAGIAASAIKTERYGG
ncbi:ferredoxin reductase [Brucella intermedia]|uniref:ferredoxin reductase n=1 Tax=Brucella intermedia TaxID=94625 RepID=UPI003AB5BAE5